MHDVLVNALGVTNASGRAVLIAHLDAWLAARGDRCRFHLLVSRSASEWPAHFKDRVSWRFAPSATAHWLGRAAWEYTHLAREVAACDASLYFSPSGIASRTVSIPQLVFCMNPWALVSRARRRRDGLKAGLQRWAYRDTVQRAAGLAYLSHFMQAAYHENAGQAGPREVIAYQPVVCPERDETIVRASGRIVCVSVMAPHKNIETLLQALARLPDMPEAHLHLVGSWPDPAYERFILRRITSLGIEKQVEIMGHVSRAVLLREYASAKVFCLMSRCESFGIPAVEAQMQGTPVVTSNICAMPEVCGEGGICLAPDDVDGVAQALALLLRDETAWNARSEMAARNATRFSVSACTEPLIRLGDELLTWHIAG